MVIVLIVAALILIDAILLVVKARGGSSSAPVGRDRLKEVGPGEAKPKEHRATGLD